MLLVRCMVVLLRGAWWSCCGGMVVLLRGMCRSFACSVEAPAPAAGQGSQEHMASQGRRGNPQNRARAGPPVGWRGEPKEIAKVLSDTPLLLLRGQMRRGGLWGRGGGEGQQKAGECPGPVGFG